MEFLEGFCPFAGNQLLYPLVFHQRIEVNVEVIGAVGNIAE